MGTPSDHDRPQSPAPADGAGAFDGASASQTVSCGISVWDSDFRLVLSNPQFAEIYGLAPGAVRPGTGLDEVCATIVAAGADAGADYVEASRRYRDRMQEAAESGTAIHGRDEVRGRSIQVVVEWIEGLGWFASHQDLSQHEALIERLQQREAELKRENLRFDAAVRNMAHGLTMYDSNDRLVVCNQRYIEMYDMPEELTRPGTRLEDILAHRKQSGATLINEEGDFVRRTIDDAQAGIARLATFQLTSGKIIKVSHQPMEDGGFVATHRNITEDVERMEALKAREEEAKQENVRFTSALENMPHGLSMYDANQRLVVCNERYRTLYDLPPELVQPGTSLKAMLEYRWEHGIRPADGDENAEAFNAQVLGIAERGESGVFNNRLPDGRSVRIIHNPMPDGGVVAIHQDITDDIERVAALQQRERELEVQNIRFETVIDTVAQGISLFDSNHRLTVANENYARLYDLPPELMKPGTDFEDILKYRVQHGVYPVDGADDYVEQTLAMVARGEPMISRVELRSGKVLSVSHQPMPGGGFLGTHMDITDEVQRVKTLEAREAELQLQNLRFDAAVNKMAHGLVMFDGDERLVICNDIYIKMFDLPPELSRPGASHLDITNYRIANGMHQLGENEEFLARHAEFRRDPAPGDAIVKLANGRIISIHHNPMGGGGWVATHQDITEEVERLETLKAREAELQLQNLRFEAAVNNMTHGLVMYDGDRQLVICNDAYAEIYGLPPALMQPGTSIEQILDTRLKQGIVEPGVADEYRQRMLEVIEAGEPCRTTTELGDGRIIYVIHKPMPDGGWVATHQDITERRRAEAVLAEAESRWNFALESAGQGVWDANLREDTMFYSRLWKTMRGFDPDEDVDPDFEKFMARLHPDDRGRIRDIIERQNTGEIDLQTFEYRERHQDGHWIWIKSRGRAVERFEDGRPARVIGTDTDITRQKELELELESNLALLNTTFDNFPGGISLVDADLNLQMANAGYYEILGLDKQEFPFGTPLKSIIEHLARTGYYGEGDFDKIVSGRVANAGRRERQTHEREMPNGGRIIQFKRSPLLNGGFVQTMEDVTERRLSEQRIRHLARHDPLTDLPNRLRFQDEMRRVEAAIKRGDTVAIMSIDLDRFKSINDTLGHAVGDAVLKQFATKLTSVLREGDVAARLGGDEFAVLAPSIDEPAHAANIAARLISLFSEPVDVDGHRVMIGASVGIAVAPHDGVETDALMKNADLALYRAKADGRGAYHFFEKGMDEALQRRRKIEAGLKHALEEDRLRLVYQPVLNLQDLKILGFEALLRWDTPDGEDIGPSDFIPVAEDTGLIIPIGEWVLRQACEAAAGWPTDVGVSVNLSPVQFRAKNLIEIVSSALEESGLAPERLELEITESLLLSDDKHTLGAMQDLRALGVRISMDDFGTGYSSLSYFRTFPFDKIKIDRSFISELGERADNLAIITAVIELSRTLGMVTTAEGIETEEQMNLLRAEGCEEAQGFLFSPPLPANAVAGLLRGDGIAEPGEAERPDEAEA